MRHYLRHVIPQVFCALVLMGDEVSIAPELRTPHGLEHRVSAIVFDIFPLVDLGELAQREAIEVMVEALAGTLSERSRSRGQLLQSRRRSAMYHLLNFIQLGPSTFNGRHRQLLG